MNINNRVGLALSITLLFASTVTAQPRPTTRPQPPTPSPTISTQQREELEKLQQEKQIRDRVQNEVDRAFNSTTTILNILLVVLTVLPIFATFGIWLLYRSVISQLVSETKKQLEEEVEKQLKSQVTEEFKQQTKALLEQQNKDLQEKINKLKSEFDSQVEFHLGKLISDAQTAQTEIQRIVTELSQLTPQPSVTQESRPPETQQKIQQLTTDFQNLESNPLIRLTANDYFTQGNALFYENRYEEAIASYDKAIEIEPNDHEAWYNRGLALANYGEHKEALQSFNQALTIKPEFPQAWHGKGKVLVKLGHSEVTLEHFESEITSDSQKYQEAITSYNNALKYNPDYYDKICYDMAAGYALIPDVENSIKNLQKAIKLNPESREMAKTDPDFNTIREDERFQKLIEG